jgi:hypothetical protein
MSAKQPRKLSGLQKSCQTLYQSAMRSAALVLVLALAAAPGVAAKSHSTFRVHAEANESHGPVFSTTQQLFGKTVTLEKMPTISEQDVAGLKTYRASDGSYGALFELNEHGRLALDTVSIDRRGGRLFIFVNGRVITELQVDRRVSDGKIYLAAGLTANDIVLLRKDWPGRK